MAPVELPKHKTFVPKAETLNIVGSSIVVESLAIHPLKSVTVTKYSPVGISYKSFDVDAFDHE